MVSSMFDLWFDDKFYNFERLVRDKRPYQIVKKDGETVIIHNVVGVNEDDVKISIEAIDDRHSYINIVGESKDDVMEEEVYKINSRFSVKHSEIEEIIQKIKNGVLYLTIKWKKPETPSIKIKKE